MRRSATHIFLLFSFGVLLSLGCALNSPARVSAFAMSIPSHMEDFDRLCAALEAGGVHSVGIEGNLGTSSLLIHSEDFGRARRIAESVISNHALTVRVSKDTDDRVYEVYESG